MEKIDIGNIMDSCANAAKLAVFNWISPPDYMKEEVTRQQEMYKNRLSICNSCVLFDGATCSSIRSMTVGDKVISGCGCLMKCKAALEDNQCPAGKW